MLLSDSIQYRMQKSSAAKTCGCCSITCWVLFVLLCFAPNCKGEDHIVSPDGKVADFNRVIRPILAKHCLSCHGRDDASRQADLRLDERDTAIASGAIVSGHPDASELVKRIKSSDPDLVMPPPDTEILSANRIGKPWCVGLQRVQSTPNTGRLPPSSDHHYLLRILGHPSQLIALFMKNLNRRVCT